MYRLILRNLARP